MTMYARVWAGLWWPVSAGLFLAGVVVVPLSSLVVFVLIGAVLGGWSVMFDRQPCTSLRGSVARVATRSLKVALAMGAFACLIALVGAPAWPLVFLVAVSSPPGIGWVRARMSASSPRLMTDRELCDAWRASTHRLRAADTTSQRLGLAGLRQTYLEEMERRNTAGLRAWLDTTPYADHQLDRFLMKQPADGD